MGFAANGILSQQMGTSFRRVAGLSPTLLFLPTTNLEHFLVKNIGIWIQSNKKQTYSSDNPYIVFRYAFISINSPITTDVRTRASCCSNGLSDRSKSGNELRVRNRSFRLTWSLRTCWGVRLLRCHLQDYVRYVRVKSIMSRTCEPRSWLSRYAGAIVSDSCIPVVDNTDVTYLITVSTSS